MPSLDNSEISARTRRFMEETIGQDADVVRTKIAARHVDIRIQPGEAESYTAQQITFTLLNLLIRLDDFCPRLSIGLPESSALPSVHPLMRLLTPGSFDRSLAAFFAPFPSSARLSVYEYSAETTETWQSEQGVITVSIGHEMISNTLTVWSDGWLVFLNEHAPHASASSAPNSIGANVAGGLAAAEVFKHLIAGIQLKPGLKVSPLERLVFSAYDYGLHVGENPPLPLQVNLDNVVVVGLGGIGAGFVAAATSLPTLVGKLTLVDRDVLSTSNLNRHLVARPGDEGYKVDLCRSALSFHDDVDARAEWFAGYVEEHGKNLELVVVGVDKDEVRRDIQASMPRLILNAGTSDLGSFQVTRHDYPEGACLSCIARDDIQDHPVERQLARQLGLDLQTILDYQTSGEPVPHTILREAGKLTDSEIDILGDLPIPDIQVRVCTELTLGVGQDEETVSISFLSALPGFLLLGEVIKERSYPGYERAPLNHAVNNAFMSVLGRPHPALLHGRRDKSPGCDCTRPAYQRAYTRKWSSPQVIEP